MESIQLSLFGKMYPEPLAATKEKTSEPYLKSLLESSSRQPLCLRFRKQDGHTQTVTPETDGVLRTEFLTLNTGESPSAAVGSTLSSILEANAPEKYYLSAKACEGILRRAERRGKQLPQMLKDALEQMIDGCEGGGKGALIQEDKSATLATNNDQYLFQPISIENHPADSRVSIDESGKVQTLTSRMGTGGGNVPMVMEPVGCIASSAVNAEITDGRISPRLMARAGTGGNQPPLIALKDCATPIHDQATRFSGKRGDKADGKGNGLGVGEPGDPMNTLTAGDRHAVAYLASGKEAVDTLMANAGTKLWLGNQEAFSGDYHIIEMSTPPTVRYIVRRLTPTECARLQGFPDYWGHFDEKDSFTPEEYRFWLDVRNTHAAINGKPEKEYTEAQMLTWYNKLHTDSAEYKMWGNGIALPPALYCMQGMADALNSKKEAADE